jgi:hypothetical protein
VLVAIRCSARSVMASVALLRRPDVQRMGGVARCGRDRAGAVGTLGTRTEVQALLAGKPAKAAEPKPLAALTWLPTTGSTTCSTLPAPTLYSHSAIHLSTIAEPNVAVIVVPVVNCVVTLHSQTSLCASPVPLCVPPDELPCVASRIRHRVDGDVLAGGKVRNKAPAYRYSSRRRTGNRGG